MSKYEELVERVARAMFDNHGPNFHGWDSTLVSATLKNLRRQDARVALAEVLRTLETMTPEMETVAFGAFTGPSHHRWSAMLHASPLVPPK